MAVPKWHLPKWQWQAKMAKPAILAGQNGMCQNDMPICQGCQNGNCQPDIPRLVLRHVIRMMTRRRANVVPNGFNKIASIPYYMHPKPIQNSRQNSC
jgi:hypothetical protein